MRPARRLKGTSQTSCRWVLPSLARDTERPPVDRSIPGSRRSWPAPYVRCARPARRSPPAPPGSRSRRRCYVLDNRPVASPFPILTERLILRPFQDDDLDAMVAIYGREDVSRYLDWGPRSRDDIREWLARIK